MILIDTSVWISLYRKDKAEIGQKMWALTAANEAALCGQVWVEFVGGFRKKDQRKEYEKLLKAYPFLDTSREAYEKAAEFLANHPRLGAGDAIIAATAVTQKVPLLTLDHDFKVLEKEGLEIISSAP
ncbi:MAG: PIN domain-containing protein [Deltaproteobacteria bacterium]|nr:PIN domain-containing protein [Deltaproteobacteria bacterium]